MLQSRFFRICLGIIAILCIIYLTSKVSFLFKPLLTIINILVLPVMLSLFFYYLLRPIVDYLSRRNVPAWVSILLIYFVLAAIVVVFSILIWPILQTQMVHLIDSAPQLIKGFKEQIEKLQNNRMTAVFSDSQFDLSTKLSDSISKGAIAAYNYFSGIVSAVTSFIIVVATVPIILYYMLKQGRRIPEAILGFVPRRYRKDGEEVIGEIDSALSGFIVGRVIITLLLGVMLYIGYLIVGLPYSLLLVVVATFLNLIPYIGQVLGAIPCLIVALTVSPTMAVWVLIVTVIAQQIEGNLLSPNIYGRRLDIHPLTTVLLLLVAGEIAGILGVIMAIPAYMVVKILLRRIYRLFFMEKVEEFVE